MPRGGSIVMKMLIVGIGDAFTRRHFSTSAVVQAPHGYVLIDCPDLVHRALHEATTSAGWALQAENVDDILLTHLHGDHCNGLESFGFYRRLYRMQHPEAIVPRLHLSAPSADRLWERLAPAMHAPMGNHRPSRLEDYFDVRILDPTHESVVAGMRVQCRFTQHPIPTTGLLLRDVNSSLGWSSDTPFDPDHIAWLNQADVIVHESNRGNSHTPIERLNALPDAVRGKMRLIHLVDDFDCKCTNIRILKQGEVVELEA
jgi:ribonuclease BN (tRNA processing enzyme)